MLVVAGAGTLPDSWADEGSFPALQVLAIQSGTKMSGTLPPEWGSPTAWQQLQYLYIIDCPLTGEYIFHPLSLLPQEALPMDCLLSYSFYLTAGKQVEGVLPLSFCYSPACAPSFSVARVYGLNCTTLI